MDNTEKKTIPPRGKRFDSYEIFTERFVIMRGSIYYMRVFKDDSVEFSSYDEKAKKWIFLNFPSELKVA